MHKSIAVLRFAVFAAFIALISDLSPDALAGVVENFDEAASSPSNAVNFNASNFYAIGLGGNAIGNSHLNALIIQNSAFVAALAPYGSISNDQSGSGYFLADYTLAYDNPSAYAGEVWGTPSPVPVTPDGKYSFTFYLTNAITENAAVIQPMINGQSIGLPVSANGFFADGNPADQWQKFSFNWNAGPATTADLSLWNQIGTGNGNDFGIDAISLNTVPEPSSVALAASGLVGLIACVRRRRPESR